MTSPQVPRLKAASLNGREPYRAEQVLRTFANRTISFQENRFESERLDTPRLERLVIVAWVFGVDLHAVAKFADVFVERGFEPAVA